MFKFPEISSKVIVVLLGIGVGGLAGCSSGSGSRSELALKHADRLEGVESSGALDGQIVSRINAFRASRGKGPLRRHAGLDRLAALHAADMMRRGKMSHYRFHYRQFEAEKNYGLENLHENVIWGRGLPKSELGSYIVKAWIESIGHRHNLLSANAHIGVAVVIGPDGTFYGAQLAARPCNEYVAKPGGPMELY